MGGERKILISNMQIEGFISTVSTTNEPDCYRFSFKTNELTKEMALKLLETKGAYVTLDINEQA